MSELQIQGIAHSYAEKTVLHPLYFTVKQGEIVVLTGASGAGKSTLLKIMGALLQPSAGFVAYAGQRILGPRELLVPGHKDIRYVAQQAELMPMLTAAQNIAQGALHLMPQTQEERTAYFLNLFKLTEVGAQPLRTLSGGQQQRVALAKQLVAGGEMFLFDEVFSQLDMDTKTHVMLAIKQFIKQQGKSAVFVLHDPLDTFYLADRVLVLEEGLLVQDDTPARVYAYPVSITTAKLFGLVNSIPHSMASRIWPQHTFHRIGDNVVVRPSQIKLHDLPAEATIKNQLQLPEGQLAEVLLYGISFFVSV